MTPFHPEDFEVEKDGTTLHVMKYGNGQACVIERNPSPGERGPIDLGPCAPYDRAWPIGEILTVLERDGWTVKTTGQIIVEQRGNGYGHCTVSGVCSPDVTEEDVKKRFYHWYFGGRNAWVKDGRFGCTIHTD